MSDAKTIGAGGIVGFLSYRAAHHVGWTNSEDKSDIDSIHERDDSADEKISVGEMVKYHNGYKVLGYLPIAGLFIGYFRLRCGAHEGKYMVRTLSTGARVLIGIRGTLEMLGLGIVFLIPDIIAGLIHHYRAKGGG